MKNIKKTKKAVKPLFIVNITDCSTANDIVVKFAQAKQQAGLALTDTELEAVVNDRALKITDICSRACFACGYAVGRVAAEEKAQKKQPWYKRFWRWLTRK